MPRTCTVCIRPERTAIDQELVHGTAYRTIADRYQVSKTALIRHKAEHLPGHNVKAKEAATVADADDLLGQVQALRQKALDLLAKAEDAGDYRTALAGVRKARACIETLLEVEGELDRRPRVDILIAPEWLAVRSALFAALHAFPDARQAVAVALQELDDGRARQAA